MKVQTEPAGQAAAIADPQADAGVVKVHGVRKVYGGAKKGGEVVAVDGVDLTVASGELVVLLGPSGCGKTTLLRSIAGLETPSAGSIEIGGTRVFSAEEKINFAPEARRVGMMFQSYALWPHMTVFANIAYPLKGTQGFDSRAIAERVGDLLERLGIAGLDKRYPGELSGGQAQRVALARALAASPSILLFDEPLSNVDAKVRRRLRAELREVKKNTGFAGVYVTHDQEEAMELADRLAVMENGKIRQIDTTRAVYTQPASIYVAGFVGEINRWPATVARTADGGVDLLTEFGRFPCGMIGQAPQPDARGWLMIRPERIRIDTPATGRASGMRGRVVDAIYFGARYEFRVALDSGGELLVHLSDHGGDQKFPAIGEPVDVTFAEGSVQWLPE